MKFKINSSKDEQEIIKELEKKLSFVRSSLLKVKTQIDELSRDRMQSKKKNTDIDEIDSIREKLKRLHDQNRLLTQEKHTIKDKIRDIEYKINKEQLDKLRYRRDHLQNKKIPELKIKLEKFEDEKKMLESDILKLASKISKAKYK